MEITRHPNARSFLSRTRDLLEAHEALNGLLLGLSQGMLQVDDPDPEQTLFVEIAEHGVPVFAAIRHRHPEAIIYGSPDHWAGIAPFVWPVLRGFCPGLTGLRGPRAQVLDAIGKQPHEITFDQGLYRLDLVTPVEGVPGRARRARMEELDELAEWACDFVAEALHEAPNRERRHARTRRMIEGGALWVWEDDQIKAMTATLRPLRRSICISYVYTPPPLRGQGYASALTAAVSQAMLDEGYCYCTLFTDLANPTSNRIYQRIGYYRFADFVNVSVGEAE